MLKKIFKHEWKSVSKIGVMLLIVMAVLTFLGWLSFKTPMWQAMTDAMSSTSSSAYEDFMPNVADVIGIFGLMFYYLLICFASFGFLIYIAVHFYRTMYTDQGYLTHTLPVSPTQLLAGKALVSSVWTMLINLGMILSILFVLGSFLSIIFEGIGVEWAEIKESFDQSWPELVLAFKEEADFSVYGFIVLLILVVVLTPFTTTITMFGAITLGQLSKSARGFMGAVWYVVVYLGEVILATIITSVLSVGTMYSTDIDSDLASLSMYNTSYATTLIIQVTVAVVMWFVARWIIQKKINLH